MNFNLVFIINEIYRLPKLLLSEGDWQGVRDVDWSTVLFAGSPGGHGFDDAQGFLVECGMKPAEDAHFIGLACLSDYKLNNYLALDFFICCLGRIFHIVSEPFIHL